MESFIANKCGGLLHLLALLPVRCGSKCEAEARKRESDVGDGRRKDRWDGRRVHRGGNRKSPRQTRLDHSCEPERRVRGSLTVGA